MEREVKLYETYIQLMEIKNKCSYSLEKELNMSELTLRQIEYIKKIGKYEYITISKLAEMLDLSKPTITQMVKKFVNLNCVYKKQCNNDGRVQYIYLTDKGRNIANFENLAMKRMIEKIVYNIEKKEIDVLINILIKIN